MVGASASIALSTPTGDTPVITMVGPGPYCGFNTTSPSHTVHITNINSTVNALNIQNAAATSTILSVSDAGNLTVLGTISCAILVLPSTYVAPTSTQLGCTVNLSLTGLTLSTYNANSQNICGTSGTGRNITVSVGGRYIVTWNYTVTPSNPSNPSYIYSSTTEATSSADS